MYVELHAASAFSFLQGASLPEALVDRAADLGYSAVALLDRDGVYGAPRFHKAALRAGIRPLIGAELTVTNSEFPTPNSQFALPVLCESADGYRKVTEIIRGDEVLRTGGGGQGRRGGGGGPNFGEAEYYLAFLGTPSATTPWRLQFGGHHLAINLTLAGSQATMAPSLPAAQPATYTFEGREIRPLGKENDKAFALIGALDEKQRGQAIIGAASAHRRDEYLQAARQSLIPNP